MLVRCKICGTEFEKSHNSQVYCSDECRTRAKKIQDHFSRIKRQQQKPERTAKCEYCGKIFIKKHGNQKYCSKRCKKNRKMEQNANASLKYYHSHKKKGGDKVWGLGSGGLGPHCHDDPDLEHQKISNELKRLRLKK